MLPCIDQILITHFAPKPWSINGCHRGNIVNEAPSKSCIKSQAERAEALELEFVERKWKRETVVDPHLKFCFLAPHHLRRHAQEVLFIFSFTLSLVIWFFYLTYWHLEITSLFSLRLVDWFAGVVAYRWVFFSLRQGTVLVCLVVRRRMEGIMTGLMLNFYFSQSFMNG